MSGCLVCPHTQNCLPLQHYRSGHVWSCLKLSENHINVFYTFADINMLNAVGLDICIVLKPQPLLVIRIYRFFCEIGPGPHVMIFTNLCSKPCVGLLNLAQLIGRLHWNGKKFTYETEFALRINDQFASDIFTFGKRCSNPAFYVKLAIMRVEIIWYGYSIKLHMHCNFQTTTRKEGENSHFF